MERNIPYLQPAHRNWVRFILEHTVSVALSRRRIFATPSTILRASGSVGFGLVMWLLGAIFAMAGTAVYVELGTVRVLSVRWCRIF